MSIERARELAEVLGGEVVEAGDGWLVLIERADGRVVLVSGSSVEEYPDREAIASGRCYACISLS